MSTTTDVTAPATAPTIGRRPRRRWPWVVAGGVVAVALVGQGASALAELAARGTETTTVTHPGVDAVEVVDRCAGDLTITGPASSPGGETGSVTVISTDSYAFQPPRHDDAVVGGVLHVEVRCPALSLGPSRSSDLQIFVPGPMAVTASTGAGDVSLVAVTGRTTISTGAGDVGVSAATGPLDLSTGAGDVLVSGTTSATVDVSTAAGDVEMRVTRPPRRITATTGSGDLHLTVPDDGGYAVDATSGSGDVSVAVPRDDASGRALHLRSGAGDVSVTAR